MAEIYTQKIPFADLEFLDDNPRTIKEPKFKTLVERIRNDPDFFQHRPCLVNHTEGRYLCYAGFQRAHAAAKVLRWKEIPCSVENDVPMDLMRRRAIYDNTHDGEWNSEVLSSWEYEVEEYREMGVPEWVFGGVGEENGQDVDYSQRNQEIDVNEFSDLMELKFKYEKDAFLDVQERLNVVCAKQNVDTKEAALTELLMFYERHG